MRLQQPGVRCYNLHGQQYQLCEPSVPTLTDDYRGQHLWQGVATIYHDIGASRQVSLIRSRSMTATYRSYTKRHHSRGRHTPVSCIRRSIISWVRWHSPLSTQQDPHFFQQEPARTSDLSILSDALRSLQNVSNSESRDEGNSLSVSMNPGEMQLTASR
jgi:hypothetical protein